MSFADQTSVLSAHVRYGSRDAVVDALVRLGVGHGAPVPVWPPRRLPYGLMISPVRNGWVSLWSPLEDVREWLPRLAATLECPGVILEAVQSRFLITEFYRDNDFIGRMELPAEAVAYDDLWARTAESLEAEGLSEPWEDEGRFSARLDQIAASEEYQQDVAALREEQPEPEALRPFLPPYASVEQAWELVTAIDRDTADGASPDEESSPYAEDYLESFASYLGILDATWDPAADADALSEGDYDEEGLPEGWRDFVVLPIRQLPVL